MKVVHVEFLEPIDSPIKGQGGGRIDKFKASATDKAVSCRPFGPGFVLEQEGNPDAIIVPWAAVKFARVQMDESDQKKNGGGR
jgi:hypothetical protein